MDLYSVSNRYKLYKAGTAKVVQWLATTADLCGDITPILKSLKSKCGKNHKNSKSKYKKNSAQKLDPSGEIDILSHELVALAQHIASADPPVNIPSTILERLSNVIAGREACAKWYTSQGLKSDSTLQKQNDGHAHFIQILNDVHSVLSSAKGCETPQMTAKENKAASTGAPDTTDKLRNSFSCLEIEEPSESPLGEASQPTSCRSATITKSQTASFKLRDREEDTALELWCLIEDLNDMRNFVCETWMQFVTDQLSLLVATKTTDTAFGLMRRTTEEFATRHPEIETYQAILSFLGIETKTSQESVQAVPLIRGPASKSHSQRPEVDVLLCRPACAMLLTFMDKARGFAYGMTVGQLNIETPSQSSAVDNCEDLGSVIFNTIPTIVCLAQTIRETHPVGNQIGFGDEF